MDRDYAITEYNDNQLFIHDNRDTDWIEFMPPVTQIGFDVWDKRYIRYSASDDDYQAIYDEMVSDENMKAFGEGWEGMGQHISAMTGLQRQIFEDCFDGSGAIQRPGMNIPQVAKHLRPEWLEQRLLRVDLTDCEILAECFRTLDLTYEIVIQLIVRFNAAPNLDACIEYMVNLAFELAKCEQPSVNWDPAPAEYNPDNMIDYTDWVDHNCWDNGIEDRHMPDGREFAYVTIGNDLGEDHWMDHQSRYFKELIARLPKIKSYTLLKKLGAGIYKIQSSKKPKLTKEQAMVFWSKYKIRKAILKARVLVKQPTAAKLTARVLSAPAEKVKYMGFWLFDQQSRGGKTMPSRSIANLDKQAWSLVWEAYSLRKAELPENQAKAAGNAILDEMFN